MEDFFISLRLPVAQPLLNLLGLFGAPAARPVHPVWGSSIMRSSLFGVGAAPLLVCLKFLKKYKQEASSKSIPESPVIVISGISKKNVVEDLLKIGITNYILKPFGLKTYYRSLFS